MKQTRFAFIASFAAAFHMASATVILAGDEPPARRYFDDGMIAQARLKAAGQAWIQHPLRVWEERAAWVL